MNAEVYVGTCILCGLFSFGVFVCSYIAGIRHLAMRLLYRIALCSIMLFTVDAICGYIAFSDVACPASLDLSLAFAFDFLVGLLSCFWIIYVLEVLDSSFLKTNKRNYYICHLPLVYSLMLFGLSLVYPDWLSDDTSISGIKGIVFIVFQLGYLAPLLGVGVYTFKHFRAAKGLEYFIKCKNILIFPIPVLIGFVLHYITNYPSLEVGILLGMMIMVFFNQTISISVDPLTHVYNRLQFERDLNHRVLEKGENGRLFMAVLDLDHFHQETEKWGWDTVQTALADFGRIMFLVAMRNHCRSYRYGGDEFILLSDSRERIETVCEDVVAQSAEYSDTNDVRLHPSIGILEYDERFYDPVSFFEACDKVMLANKRGPE